LNIVTAVAMFYPKSQMHIIAWFDNLLYDISINTCKDAYILFQNPQSVERALLKLNGTRYGGECLGRG